MYGVDAHQSQHLLGPSAELAGRHFLVGQDGVLQLRADGQHRVEGVHRALHDHRVAAPADSAELLLVERDHVAAFEAHLSRDDLGRRAEEACDRKQKRRLPATRLTHDAEELARGDLERDAVNRAHGTVSRSVLDHEVLDLEDRPGPDHRLRFFTGRRAGLLISSKA